MYKCIKCGSELDSLPTGIVRCPSCAHRVFLKVRKPVAKTVKAE